MPRRLDSITLERLKDDLYKCEGWKNGRQFSTIAEALQ
jgi:hypothetical protein